MKKTIIRVLPRDYATAKEIWPDAEIQVVKLCSICEFEPSRFHGGPCDDCEKELGVGA